MYQTTLFGAIAHAGRAQIFSQRTFFAHLVSFTPQISRTNRDHRAHVVHAGARSPRQTKTRRFAKRKRTSLVRSTQGYVTYVRTTHRSTAFRIPLIHDQRTTHIMPIPTHLPTSNDWYETSRCCREAAADRMTRKVVETPSWRQGGQRRQQNKAK